MKTAFETADYTAHEKIEMYNKFRTKEGDPRPPFRNNDILFALSCLHWVIKYDLYRLTFVPSIVSCFFKFPSLFGLSAFTA